ncbi:MAG TPA: hypothetical protein VFA71_01555, partial [Terriglobales bacterium]|nr:hypothetical protein [Terriglobales bacterium]
PMVTGGDVIIQITHGEIPKARLDQIIRDLEPELIASSAQRVVISAVDADEPRAGRKIFEYNRQGSSFAGSVRTPFYRSGTGVAVQSPPAGGRLSFRGMGGIALNALIQLAVAFIFEKLRQWLEKKQVEEGVRRLEPLIAAAVNAKSSEIIELQSASEAPVFSTIKYSITFRHTLPDPAAKSLFEVSSDMDPFEREQMRTMKQAQESDQNQTFFAGANLIDVAIGSGTKPENQESFSIVRDPKYSNLYEDYVSTFATSTVLPRMSNVELRDYVLSQSLESELGTAEVSPERAEELRRRLERLQGAVAREEAQKKAEEERVRREEERRKQAKLDAARAAQAAPPPPQTLLTPPGPPVAAPLSQQDDPFNLSGRPVSKSLLEQSQDAADIVEALKTEFVRKANALKSRNFPSDEVEKHKAEVEAWVTSLHMAFQTWKTKGNPDWPSVKRIEYVNWWVDQPDGRNALLR